MRSFVVAGGLFAPAALVFACSTSDSAPPGGPGPGAGADASETTGEGGTGVPGGASLALARSALWVPAGGRATTAFTIGRGAVGGTLTVSATDFPAGVRAASASVPDGAGGGTLVFEADDGAALGTAAEATVVLASGSVELDRRRIDVGISGAPGAADATFGDGGAATPALPHDVAPAAVRVYPAGGPHAGKVVVAGTASLGPTDVRVVVVRLLASGELDPTFGDEDGDARRGFAVFDPGPSVAAAPTRVAAMALDGRGRVVVLDARRGSDDACLVELGRWTAAGALDADFTRYSGAVDAAACGTPTDVGVDVQGRIAVLAHVPIGPGSTPPAPEGAIETVLQLFDGEGARGDAVHVVLDPEGEKTTRLRALALDSAGRFVLAGEQCDGGWSSGAYTCRSAVVRLAAVGETKRGLDETFGAGGVTSFELGATSTSAPEGFFGVAVASGGVIVAGGRAEGGELGTLAKLGAGGAPASFGAGGALVRPILAGATSARIVRPMLDAEGRLVFFATAEQGGASWAVHGRTAADGAADPRYATAGADRTPGAGGDAALGSDDRLYVATAAPRDGGGVTFTVHRYWP